MFNKNLVRSHFPILWKKALIVPIHKSDDHTFKGYYSTIWPLCSCVNILEIINN